MKRSNRVFKMIAVTVILALVINLLPDIFGTYKAMADTTGGNEVPTYEGILRLRYGTDDSAIADIPYKEELRQVGESEYEFTLTLDPVTMINDQSDKNTSSKNGYFTAQIEGYYMVDIYGGKGGSGQSLIALGCGYGGDRGHVYGAVYLKKGDTLVYSIGGNGATVTVKDATAGNGGSAHGEEGSKEIGSGGGFSAVYLFKADESLAGYTDAQGNLNFDTIKEADRLSKLIMLAGGGGGGAADSSDINIFNTPNGGAGGNIDGSYVRVDDGIIFTGSNGISSSKSTAYVGKGGTTVPGTAVSTDSDGYSSEAGKSWADGGTGGNSNFRGGGGGAGYNGGSGGIMKGKYEASDVGGGGGGASFVSNDVLTQYSDSEENTPYSSLFSTSIPYTSFLADSTAVDNKNGGTFHIAAISSNDTYSFMKNMTISFDNISKYFDITVNTDNGTVSSVEGITSVNGINLIDYSGNGKMANIKVKFTPKAGFAGGNDVNLFSFDTTDTSKFNDISVKYSINDDGTEYKASSIAVDKNSGDIYAYVGYVNVPLKGYSILGNSKTYNENDPAAISSTDLYTRTVAENIDFINEVGNVLINGKDVTTYSTAVSVVDYYTGEGKLMLEEETPSMSAPVRYPVKFTVKPIPSVSKAKVGEVQTDTTYSTNVSINYIEKGSIEIDGHGTYINLSRELTENSGTYTYSIDGEIKFDNSDENANKQKPLADQPVAFDEDSWLICDNSSLSSVSLKPGIYYLAIKGGDGGFGNDLTLSDGGKGGIGDSYKGYFVIEKDTIISTVIGSKGKDCISAINQPEGYGGKGSSIKTGDDSVYISAGGGGGGAASMVGHDGVNGSNGGSTGNIDNGIDGSNGGKNNRESVTTPAKGGKSFKTGFVSSVDISNPEYSSIQSKLDAKVPTSTTGGYVYIALVERYRFDQVDNPEKYTYSFDVELSNYFTLNSTSDVKVSQGTSDISNCTVTPNGKKLTITVPFTYTFDNGKNTGCRKGSALDSFKFSIDINLTPIDDFLGGYDVPLLIEDSDQQTVKVQLSTNGKYVSADNNTIYLKEDDTLDYVNVAINTTAINTYLSQSGVFVTNDNQVYVKGYDPVKFSDVVNGTAAKTNFDGKNTLLDDFVSITEVVEPTDWNGAPDTDVNLPFTFKVEPTDKDGTKASSKATVVSNVSPFTLTKYAKISVKTAVEFNLTNLFVNYTLEDATVNNPSIPGETKDVKRYVFVPDGNDFKCILSTSGNYTLPLEEDVQVNYRVYSGTGDDISSQCTFNEFTGELTIPGRFFEDNSVLVKAEAQKPDDLFHIVLEYQTAPGSQTYTLYSDPEDTTDRTKGYKTDDDISSQNPTTTKLGTDNNPLIVIPEYYGYNFLWEDGLYGTTTTYGGICDLPALMPANDIYIMGSYTPKTYHVVINYYDKNTTTPVLMVKDPETEELKPYTFTGDYKFGQTIEAASPTNISGKKPETLKVSKTITESFLTTSSECTLDSNTNTVTINVYYVPSKSELTVMFVKEDGVTQMTDIKDSTRTFETITEEITLGTDYSYDLSKDLGETSTLGKVYTVDGYKTFIDPSSINYKATAADTTISGTMDANGRIVKVVYVGNKIKLSFDWTEGTNGPAKSKFNSNSLAYRYVQYGGYISDTWNDTNNNYKTYQSLPSLADVDGWHFKGWKMSGVDGYVDDDQIVNLTSDITLYADWEKTDITIHVYYRETKYGTTLGHEDISAQAGVPETITFSSRTGYTLNYPSEGFYVLNPETNKYEFSVTANNDKYVYVEFTINSYSCQYQWIVLDSKGDPMEVPGDATTGISLDDDGKTTPKNVYSTGNVDYNEGYSYVAPANPFYSDEAHKDQFRKSVTQGPTSGNMPVGGVLIIITYTEVAPDADPELICVTVTWENLDFVYTSGTWDPDTHSAVGASFVWDSESRSAAQANPKITVTNVELTATETGISDFTQPTVHVEFGYTKNTGFGDVNGSFSNNALDVYKGGSEDVTFTLSGKMNSSLKPGDVRKVGKVTVTISRSDK